MSLILDALKRAEKENRLTHAPDFSRVYRQGPVKRRLLLPVMTLLALLLLAYVGAFSLVDLGRHDSTRTPPAPETSIPIEEKARGMQEVHPRRPGSRPARTALGTSPRPPVAKFSPRPPRPTIPPARPGRAVHPKVRTFHRPAAKVAEDAVVKTGPTRGTEQGVPGGVRAQGQSPPSAFPSDPGPIREFRALPEAVKKKLPRIVILAHIYDEDPNKRFVFINDRRYRVGERIERQGPVLKEIVPDGVIVDYGEGLAHIPIE
ncbi:MAG: general secretion pathway protein GspB [Deltaproteobacteria bacterium]|nr:general secretion pathway protein GspB [Deltaproteobacteria bacterium]MBW1924496.1 general secretion pathway protein GspB [Deltaproteobacteria bacterium]MBW1949693.1 general secretion pathway protein GspB [Deltaproteobacteria bacterium]